MGSNYGYWVSLLWCAWAAQLEVTESLLPTGHPVSCRSQGHDKKGHLYHTGIYLYRMRTTKKHLVQYSRWPEEI
jgi:hypothetical protein